jgi:hypothetical protein|tara:strand:- start:1322 stop:4180 length:2859 start_codon:yes stop_codon:yes gene_type:complete
MDPVVNSLLPSFQIGSDGAQWWVGQVEEVDNPKNSNRFRVRIVSAHSSVCADVPKEDLPWAQAALPVTIPYKDGGASGATANLEPSDWVLGLWLDADKTKPIILHSIGHVANAAEEPPEQMTQAAAELNCLSFTPKINASTNLLTDQPVNQEETNQNLASGLIAGGNVNTYSAQDLSHRGKNSVSNPLGTNVCVAVAQAECNGETKKDIKYILGELFAMVSESGGNLGDYLVSKANGEIFSYVGKAKGYINKVLRVVRDAMARIRGEIIAALRKGVEMLVKLILSPFEGILEGVQAWLDQMLEKIGCSIEDILERLTDFITSLIFDYLLKVFRAATCQVDIFVNAILNKIMSFVNNLLQSVLGPLQSILSIAGNALNIVGGAMFKIMSILGISCGGVDSKCGDENTRCTSKEKEDKSDFLDDLLEKLADGPLDYGQSVCDDARGYPSPVTTGGIIYGGLPAIVPGGGNNEFIYGNPPTTGAGTLPPDGGGEVTPTERIVNYEILNVNVLEGDVAEVKVLRTGYIEASSSVTFKTVEGSATADVDYVSTSGILGFGKNQTERIIEIQTIKDSENDTPEEFSVEIDYSTGVGEAQFTNYEAIVTIGLAPVPEPGDPNPYVPPFTGPGGTPIEWPPVTGGTPEDPVGTPPDTGVTIPVEVITGEISVGVTSDKLEYKEGEFITYTISTNGIPNGTVMGYTLFGPNITQTDIVGGNLFGTFAIENNKSVVVVGIKEDADIEQIESLRFAISGTGAVADVSILGQEVRFTAPSPPVTDPGFTPPTIGNPIVDPGGKIIEIPIDNPGDPYILPPHIAITGQGYGALAIPLLDSDGYVTEIRVTQRGTNYVANRPDNVNCVLDSLTLTRPGRGYTSTPTVYIDGDSSLVVARINNAGLVIGFEVVDRTKIFDVAPKVEIVGGGGYGAYALASLSCLDSETRDLLGYAKIGTGRYVDCPT